MVQLRLLQCTFVWRARGTSRQAVHLWLPEKAHLQHPGEKLQCLEKQQSCNGERAKTIPSPALVTPVTSGLCYLEEGDVLRYS